MSPSTIAVARHASDTRPHTSLRPQSALRSITARDLLDLFEQSSDTASLESLRTHWVEALGRERAAVELIGLMRTGEPRQRATAFFWLTQIPSVIEAAIRVSIKEPNVRPYGVVWLRECGLPGPEPTAEEVRWLYVDLLAVALGDPCTLAEASFRQVAAGGTIEEQSADVAALWRCHHPATLDVLAMVSIWHPEPMVTRAARRALTKARALARG